MNGPIRLPDIALSTALAGSTGVIDVSDMPTPAGVVDPIRGPFAHLLLLNESATTLFVSPSQNRGATYPVPAGRPCTLIVPRDETSFLWTAIATVPTAYTETCYCFFYAAGLDVPDFGSVSGVSLGNQPRVVSIPLNPISANARRDAISTGVDVGPGVTTFAGTPPGGNVPNIWCYLFYSKVIARAAAGLVYADFQIEFLLLNGAALVDVAVVYNGEAWANVTNATVNPDEFYPANPIGVEFREPQGTIVTGIKPLIHFASVSGTGVTASWLLGYGVDFNNFVSPGVQGNFTPSSGAF
jgi:hypothetical protein